MKLLHKGAEGDLYLTKRDKEKAILKIRMKKDYRNNILDNQIRRQRTIRESQIISEVKSFGIHTPLVYFVDLKKCSILMQFIPGKTVHELSKLELIKCCKKIGNTVGLMHKNGIMHGDLTTSNFILFKNNIFVIDFGLSHRTAKPDDHAIDLRVFKEILNSAHTSVMEKAWRNFLVGYKNSVGVVRYNKILRLVSVIESRGRYAKVV